MQPVPYRDRGYNRGSPTDYESPKPTGPRQTTAGWLAMIVFALLAAFGALGAVTVVGGYFVVADGLDPVSKLQDFALAQESIVYDRTGQTELARFGEFKREIVTFQDLPPVLVDATTAVEDRTFWTNTGFDPAAIVAAGIDAMRGNARGASTITQQLVRQRLLDEKLVQSSGRTAERKLKEIIQSIRLTKAYPGEEGKQEIITAYLNQNFYGNNSYGVKAAAKGYFGVEPKQLTLAQAAILAALPQSPSSYDLVRNAVTGTNGKLVVPPDTDIVQRRNQVLDLMANGRTPLSKDEFGPEDFARAKTEPVVLATQGDEPWIAPHFVWAVRAELTKLLCPPDAETCDEVERGGFKITTTIDLKLQAIAEKWVKASAIVPKAKDPAAAAKALGFAKLEKWMSNLRDKDLNNGALVALDYETGELVAYVGSADYAATTGTPKFQPKFDVVGNGWRQPGSAFKPFNYLTGIDDRKITAASMFMDVGTDFGNGYTPNDADLLERGPVRVRSALQFSLNIPSVKATAVNRPEYLFQRAGDFGMRFRTQAPLAGLALGLGVQEVRPIDLVTAYGTIGNLGRYVPHTTILRVVDPEGKDRLVHVPPAGEQVASPEAASIVLDILGGNTDIKINPFWGKFAITSAAGRRPAALKTGTNNDAKDLNAYGLIGPPTPDGRQAGEYALAVGVWNGNSNNTVVGPVFSIEVSTFVWQGFLREATVDWEINPLPRSQNLTIAQVDPWTGFLPAPGQKGVPELFIPGTEPTKSIGSSGGICGEKILEASEWETQFPNWLAADRDWIARAGRGPGVRGGPDRTKTSYFYNNGYHPYGRSWGPILDGAGCATPAPSPTCFPVPTPDAGGTIPSFEIPTPAESGVPAAEPCPTPSPALETPTPAPTDTPPPLPTPELTPIPIPTPELTPIPSLPIDTPPPLLPSAAPGDVPASSPAPP
ncbi:MAG: transglycosylase domain-containing protein [Chloroflexota bacterium]|nr:transglycosylase domain-containing protein [Chloroflexota bacterium]